MLPRGVSYRRRVLYRFLRYVSPLRSPSAVRVNISRYQSEPARTNRVTGTVFDHAQTTYLVHKRPPNGSQRHPVNLGASYCDTITTQGVHNSGEAITRAGAPGMPGSGSVIKSWTTSARLRPSVVQTQPPP